MKSDQSHDDAGTITVAIPTYNRARQLPKAIESALQETRVPIVVHVFDNASSDNTEELIKLWQSKEPRLRYTRRAANIGGLLNCHYSIRAVETDYFVPLADDDWLYPEFLYEAHRVMQANPYLGAVIFQTNHLQEWDKRVIATNPDKSRSTGKLEKREHMLDWLKSGHYQWSSILWSRKVIEVIGGPEDAVGLPSDLDFQAQAFCYFSVYRVARPGAAYLLHPEQASHKGLGGNWRLIRKRFEATIRKTEVLRWEEYLALRPEMLRQWQNAWRGALRGESWGATLYAALKFAFQFRAFAFAWLVVWDKLRGSELLCKVRRTVAVARGYVAVCQS